MLLSLLSVDATSQSSHNTRAKRFAALGGPLSTVGGNLGCVVSQDKLYINGRFTKNLDEDEQEEMREYKQTLDKFKAAVKAFVEQQQKQQQQLGLGGLVVGAAGGGELASTQQEKVAPKPKQPEPPKRPSFCSEKATTQFVFDGCTVQGDSIFIGDAFVRKLTSGEQHELEQFEKEFTAYQEAVTATFKKQMEQFFNRQIGAVGFSASSFFGNSSNDLAKPENGTTTTTAEADNGGNADDPTVKLPKEPKTPEFCTLIA